MALDRTSPEEQGISSLALLAFVQEAEQKIDALHSFMLVRHGHVVAEGWWAPYTAGEPHAVYSISKSVTSTAIGLLVAEGRLDIDEAVITFFPDETPPNPSKNLSSMRVRDLLKLTTGNRIEDTKNFPYLSSSNLVTAFLELPIPDQPGTVWDYIEPAVYILSVLVQKITGQNLLNYLQPRLFEPLGIVHPTWWATADGVPLGASGLDLRTEDVARFGQLYLQDGKWNGRQLIPAAWAKAATSVQIPFESSGDSDPWSSIGYGYLFLISKDGSYYGAGYLGQFCVVMPEYDAVLVITAGVRSGPSSLNLVWEQIVPAFKDAALPADLHANQQLSEKLANLALETQRGEATSSTAAKVSGTRYLFPENERRIESLEFEHTKDEAPTAITIGINDKKQRIVCGKETWIKGTLEGEAGILVPMTGYLGGDSGESIPVAVSGAWTSDNIYAMKICRYRTAFIATYEIRFSGNEVTVEHVDAILDPSTGKNNGILLTGTAGVAKPSW